MPPRNPRDQSALATSPQPTSHLPLNDSTACLSQKHEFSGMAPRWGNAGVDCSESVWPLSPVLASFNCGRLHPVAAWDDRTARVFCSKEDHCREHGNQKGMSLLLHASSTPNLTHIQVIVVGAGPSGLILGLLLAKEGIEVELLDAGAQLDDQPRAAHYASPAAYELSRAGVLEDVKARGLTPKGFAWRKMDTTFIAGMKLDVLPEDYPYKMQVLPLDRLGKLLYEHIQRQPTATVKWSHRVVKVGQDQGKAWVDVDTPSGSYHSEADYVIGCDGASSTVRRELFGPEYPGETLNAQIIATNVRDLPLPFFFCFDF